MFSNKFVRQFKWMIPCLIVVALIIVQVSATTHDDVTINNQTTTTYSYSRRHQSRRHTQQALTVTLTVQEGVSASSFSSTGYPVSVVVPFAEGTLIDKNTLSISEGNPCQVEIMERWLSDNSIRHALVHFQTNFTSRQKQFLTLTTTGPAVKPTPTQPVTITSTSTYVQVDTGKVRFQISKTSFNLFDQLWYDQNENGIYESTEQMIVSSVDNGGRFVPRTGAGTTQKDSSRSDITIEIEESGPVRACIKVSAPTFFRSTTDHVHGYAVRIYAYAGQPFVKVDYQLQNSDSSVVRSWPLYFEEMTVDVKFQFPGGVTPQVRIGTTSRRIVDATTLPARIQQTRHDRSSILYGTTNVTETNSYLTSAKNAGFMHLQGGSTGVSIMMRNFWQTWPNGFAIDANGKVSIEMFPSWSAQYTNQGSSSTGLYWLKDMQHVYKEFMFTFHKSAPSDTRLIDATSTFQFPPVVFVPISWYRTTKATLDMGGLLPSTLSVPSYTDTFSPDLYWETDSLDSSGLNYKGNWVNFGDPEGPFRDVPCTGGGFSYDIEYYISTQYASHYYQAEIWGIGELNVRPQSLPNYNFQRDYTTLLLADVDYCTGSWRLYDNDAFKFAAPFLPNTDNVKPSYGARDDGHAWFYHAAQSYFYTGNYWMKDWYKFVGQFRRGYFTGQQVYQSVTDDHVLSHALQAFRITGDTDLITDFAYYFRNYLQPRQDKRYGSESDGGGGYRVGFLTSSIVNFMVLVQKTNIQLYAELFNYLSGWMEWNLNVGNFTNDYNQFTATSKSVSGADALPLISPQSWYFWHTGKIEFWNHIEAYMSGGLGVPPYGAPWLTTYPIPKDQFRRRTYAFVKQNMRQDLTPPNPIVDLQGSFNSGKSVTLQWTGPASAVRYHLVWSDKPIIGTYYTTNTAFINWWAANALGTSKVAAPGIMETLTIGIPYLEPPVYVAIFSFDENNNMSGMSNTAQVGVPLAPMAPAPKAPVLVPMSPIAQPIANPVPKAPVSPPTVANSPITAPSPKTKPPQAAPLASGTIIDLYPGDDLASTVNGASPGDTIVVHQGNYTTSVATSRISIEGPVVIRNAEGETRPKIRFTINVAGSRYLTIQGLEILSTGGNGINILKSGARDNKNITLEDIVIHDVNFGIKAESDVDGLRIRNVQVYATNEGEGLSLGCDNGLCVLSNSIIEYNWIHNTTADGIEINKNSSGNVIRHNVVYQTKIHGILVYGSGSGAVNIIEGNAMWDCAQAGLKVAADAIVQNNLVFNSGNGLDSSPQNGVTPKNLKIVHNTFLNNNNCLTIDSWNGKSDIIFANNAAYCVDSTDFQLRGGSDSVQLSGNVFYPSAASFPPTSFSQGRDLTRDFTDAASLNAYPISSGFLRNNNANSAYAIGIDFDGTLREKRSPTVGAYEWTSDNKRKWVITEGFKPFQEDGNGSNEPIPVPASVPIASPTVPTPSEPCRLRRFCSFGRKICFSGHNTVQILKRKNYNSTNIMSHSKGTDNDIIMMSELQVGDYVRSSTGQYTRVISFCHKDTKAFATFIQIHSVLLSNNNVCRKHSNSNYKTDTWNYTILTGLDRQGSEGYDDIAAVDDVDDNVCNAVDSLPVLELSHDHMVYVFRHRQQQRHYRKPTKLTRRSEKGWVRAVDVEIGDVLIHRISDSDKVYYGVVTDITSVQRNDGVYSPITTAGSLFVSNTLVSSYVAVLQTTQKSLLSVKQPDIVNSTATISSMPMLLLFPSNVQHMIAHITLTPIRLLCQYDFEKFCQNEVYDDIDNGYAWYSQYILYYVDWLESIGKIRSPYMFPQFMFDVFIRMLQWTITIVIMIPFLLLYFIEGICTLIMNAYMKEIVGTGMIVTTIFLLSLSMVSPTIWFSCCW